MHYRWHYISIQLDSTKTSRRNKFFAPKFVFPKCLPLGANDLDARVSYEGANFTLSQTLKSLMVSARYAAGTSKEADNIRVICRHIHLRNTFPWIRKLYDPSTILEIGNLYGLPVRVSSPVLSCVYGWREKPTGTKERSRKHCGFRRVIKR